MASYEVIKEKMSSSLNSDNTINFLLNILNGNGFGLSNSTVNLNRFLTELTKNNNNIKIINKGNRKRINNDVEIYNKKILVRTSAIGYVNNITFESFKYEREDEIDYVNVINTVNDKLDFYDYIFLIRIGEEYEEEKTKACYYYYLFPTKIFKIEGVEKMNFKNYKKKSSLSSKYWTFRSFNNFYLKYNKDLLNTYEICSPYNNC